MQSPLRIFKYWLLLGTRLGLESKLEYALKRTVYVPIKLETNVANGYLIATKGSSGFSL